MNAHHLLYLTSFVVYERLPHLNYSLLVLHTRAHTPVRCYCHGYIHVIDLREIFS